MQTLFWCIGSDKQPSIPCHLLSYTPKIQLIMTSMEELLHLKCVFFFNNDILSMSISWRYQGLMKDSSKLPLFDLRKLNASLPVASVPNNTVNILVVGASSDFIVVRDTRTPPPKKKTLFLSVDTVFISLQLYSVNLFAFHLDCFIFLDLGCWRAFRNCKIL